MRPYIQLRPILETFGYGFVVIVALLVMQGNGRAVSEFIVGMVCLFLFGAVARCLVELVKGIYEAVVAYVCYRYWKNK